MSAYSQRLTARQRRFVAEYLVEGNRTAAGSADVTAARLLGNARVCATVEREDLRAIARQDGPEMMERLLKLARTCKSRSSDYRTPQPMVWSAAARGDGPSGCANPCRGNSRGLSDLENARRIAFLLVQCMCQ